jgi:DnaJ-class molecular chaperone
MDYYKILGLTPNASDSEIKKSYRALSFKYHPDKNPDPSVAEQYKLINEAYETLNDPQKKAQYDNRNNPLSMDSILKDIFQNHSMHGHRRNSQGPQNIFEEIFKMQSMGSMGGMNMHGMAEPMIFFTDEPININNMNNINIEPLDKKVEISFEQAFKGANIPVLIEREFRKGNNIFKEQEKIYIVIPQGIDDGEIIEIPDKGNGQFDKRGSLRLHIKIIQHDTFERKGLNLIYNHTITFKESICGFEYLLHYIDSTPLKLKSSKGNIIQNGDEKPVKGKGFQRDGQTGDLIIHFKVTSQELTEEQIALFERTL